MKCFEIRYNVIGVDEERAKTVHTILFAEDFNAAKVLIKASYKDDKKTFYDFKQLEEHIIEPKIIHMIIDYFGDF